MTPLVDRRPAMDELLRLADGMSEKGPWHHVGRPWIDVPGYVWTDEDPHAGTLVADCNGTSEPINFGEWIAAASPDVVAALIRENRQQAERIAALEGALRTWLDVVSAAEAVGWTWAGGMRASKEQHPITGDLYAAHANAAVIEGRWRP